MKALRIGLAVVVGALLCAPAWAIAPKASIEGPASVAVNERIILFLSECEGDYKPFLKVKVPNDSPAVVPALFWSEDKKSALGMVMPRAAGLYEFAVVTVGSPTGKPEDLNVAIAIWRVRVGPEPTPPGPGPGPNPPPNPPGPGPNPPPNPPPAPVIVPLSTRLNVIAIYGGMPPNEPNELKFTAVRDDLTLHTTLATTLNTEWRAWTRTNEEIDKLGLRRYLLDPAVGPTILIYDNVGNIYAADGTVGAKKSIPAPMTSADVINLVKRLRGIQ
jgi:hypothetical protein